MSRRLRSDSAAEKRQRTLMSVDAVFATAELTGMIAKAAVALRATPFRVCKKEWLRLWDENDDAKDFCLKRWPELALEVPFDMGWMALAGRRLKAARLIEDEPPLPPGIVPCETGFTPSDYWITISVTDGNGAVLFGASRQLKESLPKQKFNRAFGKKVTGEAAGGASLSVEDKLAAGPVKLVEEAEYFDEELYTQPIRANAFVHRRDGAVACLLSDVEPDTSSSVHDDGGVPYTVYFDIPWFAPGRFGSIEFVINPYPAHPPGQNAKLEASMEARGLDETQKARQRRYWSDSIWHENMRESWSELLAAPTKYGHNPFYMPLTAVPTKYDDDGIAIEPDKGRYEVSALGSETASMRLGQRLWLMPVMRPPLVSPPPPRILPPPFIRRRRTSTGTALTSSGPTSLSPPSEARSRRRRTC